MSEPSTSSAPTAPPAVRTSGGLIEIDFDYRRRPWRVNVLTFTVPLSAGLLFTTLLLLVILGLVLTPVTGIGPIVLVMAGLGLAASILGWSQIVSHRAAALAREVAGKGPEAVLRAGLETILNVPTANLIRHVVRESASAGLTDITLRIADP